MTRNRNTFIWALPNIRRLGQVGDTKFVTNVSYKTLLNALALQIRVKSIFYVLKKLAFSFHLNFNTSFTFWSYKKYRSYSVQKQLFWLSVGAFRDIRKPNVLFWTKVSSKRIKKTQTKDFILFIVDLNLFYKGQK